MTLDTKHTALPFLRMNRTIYALNKRGINIFDASVQAGWNDEDVRLTDAELEDIAAFIVRAVNSHYEMLEALKGLVGWVDQVRDDPAADMVKARAAIKKAEGSHG